MSIVLWGFGEGALPTFGYGVFLEEETYFNSHYSTSGLLLPLIRKSSGPMIISEASGVFSGVYETVIFGSSGKYPITTNWTFYGEIPQSVTSSGTYFWGSLYGSGTIDQFWKLPHTFLISGIDLSAKFYDVTGTSGGYIGVWATTPGYTTPYVKIPYRVVS